MLLAISGLVVGLGVLASASASGSSSAKAGAGKAAKMARSSYCPPLTICLWSDSRFRDTKGEYHCAGRRGFSDDGIDIRKRFPLPPTTAAAACPRTRTPACGAPRSTRTRGTRSFRSSAEP